MASDNGTTAPGTPLADVGIDIGGTKIAAIVVGEDGTILTRGSAPAPARDGGRAMTEAAAALATALLSDTGTALRAAGVGAAGVVDHENGTIRAASEMFVDWVGFPVTEELGRMLGAPVRMENDVNAFLLGEAAGRSDADVLGVMLGTGVGGALIVDGELRHGPHGAAGEIGHTPGYSDLRCTCGQTGHLETLASGTSIGLRYGERTGNSLDARVVASRARAGDPDALAVYAVAGRALALACASAATLLDVPLAIVGGGVSRSWDLLAPAVEEALRTDAPVTGIPLRIVPAERGGDAVALGAIEAARRALPELVH